MSYGFTPNQDLPYHVALWNGFIAGGSTGLSINA